MGKVVAVCVSKEKGTRKTSVGAAKLLRDWGIENDAHGGRWHRQVSLLSFEKTEEFRQKGAEIPYGAFGENLLVSGYDFKSYHVGTKFRCNDVILELTQIGKECHNHCEIYKTMGECIMPTEGVFARVIHGGIISSGDKLCLLKE